MDLSTAADIAQILGLTTIVGGGTVAFVQLRGAHRQRRDQAAMDMVQTLQTPELIDEMLLVLSHRTLSPEQIRADPKLARAVLHCVFAVEMLGIMVFERVIRLDVLDRMVGGFVRGAWARLGPWVREERQRTNLLSIGEWFEWLAKRLAEHPEKSKAAGAQNTYQDWKP